LRATGGASHRTVQRLVNSGRVRPLSVYRSTTHHCESGTHFGCSCAGTPTFARLDVNVEVLKQDDLIDQEFDGLMHKLISTHWKCRTTAAASISCS
jgi:phosphate transport system protein